MTIIKRRQDLHCCYLKSKEMDFEENFSTKSFLEKFTNLPEYKKCQESIKINDKLRHTECGLLKATALRDYVEFYLANPITYKNCEFLLLYYLLSPQNFLEYLHKIMSVAHILSLRKSNRNVYAQPPRILEKTFSLGEGGIVWQ